jgi:SAM-dependent methyltransferase
MHLLAGENVVSARVAILGQAVIVTPDILKGRSIRMPNTEAFDKYGDRYDAWFEKNHEIYQAELEAIRGLLPHGCVHDLEVGVGSGKFAVPLGIETGVEPARKMAVKAAAQGVRVCGGVAENLPFPDARFELVLMVTTICFVDDVRASFREAFRVLRPGGVIVLGFVDRESALGKTYLEKREKSVFYREAAFYSVPEVRRCLEEAGFAGFVFSQTLLPGESPRIIRDGFGRGGFVVVKAVRR